MKDPDVRLQRAVRAACVLAAALAAQATCAIEMYRADSLDAPARRTARPARPAVEPARPAPQPAPMPGAAQPDAAAAAREQMIRASYQDAFGRPPAGDELQYWKNQPAGDPRLASAQALFANHLDYLRQSVPFQQDAARRALHKVFQQEEAKFPRLRELLDEGNGAPVRGAINDMLAGREGGGYRGILAWLSRPEVKQYYIDRLGIAQAMAGPQDAPAREQMIRTSYQDAFGRGPGNDELQYWKNQPPGDPRLANAQSLLASHLDYLRQSPPMQQETVKRALHAVFREEEAKSPKVRELIESGGAPVRFGISDMLAGREGGGYRGILAWVSRPEVKKYYVDNAGIGQLAVAGQCVQGAYVFGGTKTGPEQNDLMVNLYRWLQPRNGCRLHAHYFSGIWLASAWGIDGIHRDARKQICEDLRSHGVNEVYLYGFSRGAFVAVAMANGDKWDCPGVAAPAAQGMVKFVGLVDPVRTSLPTWEDKLRYRVPAVQILKDILYQGGDANVQNQTFRHEEDTGFIRVYSYAGGGQGKCLDAQQLRNGDVVRTHDCYGAQQQRFDVTPNGPIRVRGTNKCLDVRGADRNPGAELIVWDCSGSDNQRFGWERGPKEGFVRAAHSRQCLDVAGDSRDSGGKLVQWNCKPDSAGTGVLTTHAIRDVEQIRIAGLYHGDMNCDTNAKPGGTSYPSNLAYVEHHLVSRSQQAGIAFNGRPRMPCNDKAQDATSYLNDWR